MKKVLSLVLALAMVFCMSAMVFAGETSATAKLEASVEGSTITITVRATGDMAVFDFGVTYDKSQVDVTKVAVDKDFRNNILGDSGEDGMVAASDLSDNSYIVIGGSTTNGLATNNDVIATLTFTAKDGVTPADVKFTVVRDSAAVYKELNGDDQTKDLTAASGDDVLQSATVDEIDVNKADVPTETPDVGDNNGNAGNTDNNGNAGNAGNAGTAATNVPAATKAPAPSPKTADAASVVLPVVAMCAAAAVVVVASKKKVEE